MIHLCFSVLLLSTILATITNAQQSSTTAMNNTMMADFVNPNRTTIPCNADFEIRWNVLDQSVAQYYSFQFVFKDDLTDKVQQDPRSVPVMIGQYIGRLSTDFYNSSRISISVNAISNNAEWANVTDIITFDNLQTDCEPLPQDQNNATEGPNVPQTPMVMQNTTRVLPPVMSAPAPIPNDSDTEETDPTNGASRSTLPNTMAVLGLVTLMGILL